VEKQNQKQKQIKPFAGGDISAGLLRRSEGFPAEFLTTPWTYEAGRLPGLLGQSVDMPSHLAPP